MRNGVPRTRATGRALTMLEAVIADGGRSSVAALARALGMPVSTAHRQVATLVSAGFLVPSQQGRHICGPRLLGLLQGIDEKQVVASVAAPLLEGLARQVRAVVQLGTFDEDMVTYRVKTGTGANDLFTRVGMQLEAYCSAIGKVLLAHLPERERRAYLASGPFVALTPQTIVDPLALDRELRGVDTLGYAIDNGEVVEELFCISVPIRHMAHGDGRIVAAISASWERHGGIPPDFDARLASLREAASRIEERFRAAAA